MVNHGPSKGCQTCRQRRVKCDEAKPQCQRCLRFGRICGGYDRKTREVRFIEGFRPGQTQLRKTGNGMLRLESTTSIPTPLGLSEDYTAVSFFIRNFATLGRDFQSTRGLFEVLPAVLSQEPHDSAVSIAVEATGVKLYTLWTKGVAGAKKTCDRRLGGALSRLRSNLQAPSTSNRDRAVMAALILQFYENISAVFEQRTASRVHHDGAVALLKHRKLNDEDTPLGRHLMCCALHVEVSCAVREKRRVPDDISSWFKCDDALLSPSSKLDMIGISVADLQYRFCQLCLQNPNSEPVKNQLQSIWLEAAAVMERLDAWQETAPDSWRPSTLNRPQERDIALITYLGICDIYPSVQIAAIWNVWRCYRLILVHISLAFLHLDGNANSPEYCIAQGRAQQTVDSICFSIPFFLGNRTWRSSLRDLTDSRLYFPSYHNLDTTDAALDERIRTGNLMNRSDHIHHAIMQGPWHIMSPLSHILSLSIGRYGSLLTQALRPGQCNWIREQLLRTGTLLNLRPGSILGIPDREDDDFSIRGGQETLEADALAKKIRDGLRVTSGS